MTLTNSLHTSTEERGRTVGVERGGQRFSRDYDY